jgi:hypothetical protein
VKPADFRRIEAYLVAQGLAKSASRFAFPKFIESVEYAVAQDENAKGKPLTAAEEQAICEKFLQPPSMDTYFSLAKASIDLERTNLLRPVGLRIQFMNFAKSLATNVLSSFVFVILVVLIYAAAEDQVKSLLVDLGVGETDERAEKR